MNTSEMAAITSSTFGQITSSGATGPVLGSAPKSVDGEDWAERSVCKSGEGAAWAKRSVCKSGEGAGW